MATVNETLEKFNNGEQRYEEDQNFKEAIDSLANRIGVYAVLDKTLNQLRVLREIHAKTIILLRETSQDNQRNADKLGALEEVSEYWRERSQKLADEAENLRASNRSLIESNIKLTERLQYHEVR